MKYKHPQAKVLSFLLEKCPRCGKCRVFLYSVLNLGKFAETHMRCAHCNLTYQPEQGFFFGAMYWSYAILVGLIGISAVVGTMLGAGEQLYWILPLGIIVVLPWVFRYSRMLMLYIVYPTVHKQRFLEDDNT
jgi:uncharacterized protein (DUF983 family)